MDLSYYVVWNFLVLAVSGQGRNPSSYKKSINREELTLESNLIGLPRRMKLYRVERSLANGFLPAWLTTNDYKKPFEKIIIEDNLGEFSFYHNPCTKSAFVYFHNRDELNGIIDLTYFIKGLSIDETKDVYKIEKKNVNRMYGSRKPSNVVLPVESDNEFGKRPVASWEIYLELLIAINYDTFRTIEENSILSPGIATISHILTVYNAADMLYSFMSSLKIKLNIAGIVIEGQPHQWNFESVYSNPSSTQIPSMNVTAMHPRISKYFWLREHQFPRHSFDMIVYHTTSHLEAEEDITVNGQSMGIGYDYMFPPNYHKDRFTAVIKDFTTCKHFTTIAHELAHLLGASHDKEGPYAKFFDTKLCKNSLMAETEVCSKSCLVWSRQTETEIRDTLRSPFVCNLINPPRSLYRPGPQYGLPASFQCECYGFDSLLEPTANIPENACRIPLTCVARSTEEDVEVPLPMDNTPCGKKKVCWIGHCVILNTKTP